MKKRWAVIATVLVASLVLAVTAAPVLAQSQPSSTADVAPRCALAIEAPRVAPVGEQVTITVFQRMTQEPVKDAEVWALTREDALALREELASLREQGVKPADIDFGSIISGYGTSLGTTNGAGKLIHTFEEPGGYVLVAAKGNCIPGFTRIFIAPEATQNQR